MTTGSFINNLYQDAINTPTRSGHGCNDAELDRPEGCYHYRGKQVR